ncbi:MAG: argininosuccinate lyase [Kiritimatiellia bacterium]
MAINRKTVVGAIDPDVLAFTEGKDPILDLALAQWDCIGTAAHVTMLSRMEVTPAIFSREERNAVVAELREIIQDAKEGRFCITAEDQDVHLAVERRLTAKLGELGRRVHTGRSRNDQVAVDIRLHVRSELVALSEEIAMLSGALIAFGKRHAKMPMVGRTHLQPAMPTTVGCWASGWGETLLDDLIVLEGARRFNNRNPLGSAAGYGVPLPLDRGLTTRLLGFDAPLQNVFHASNARGKDEAVLLDALKQVMLTLSRMAEDLILFSMPEFGYFRLPRELCTGSSIMPQKYNPDLLELIRAKAALLLGYSTAASAVIKAMPGGYNRDLQDTKELYMEGLRVTRGSVRIMMLLAGRLAVDEGRLRAAFAEPGVFATDAALELVAGGMPFRDAYHQIRDHLEDLRGMDPDAVLARKRHLGAGYGVDYAALAARAAEAKREAKAAAKAIERTVGALLKPLR